MEDGLLVPSPRTASLLKLAVELKVKGEFREWARAENEGDPTEVPI